MKFVGVYTPGSGNTGLMGDTTRHTALWWPTLVEKAGHPTKQKEAKVLRRGIDNEKKKAIEDLFIATSSITTKEQPTSYGQH